jgi:hypothetical protein
MFMNGSCRTDWDLDTHGNVVATPVMAFDVVAFESTGTVAVRFEGQPEPGEVTRVAQTALTAGAALKLADDLRRAAERLLEREEPRARPASSPHISKWA